MLIIVAADTVGGVPGVSSTTVSSGVNPAPVTNVPSNVKKSLILKTPGLLQNTLKQVPEAMASVLQQNPALMSDPIVMANLPQILATNGNIMNALPDAMFMNQATMDAFAKSNAFIDAMMQNQMFMRALNSDPAVRDSDAQASSEAAQAVAPAAAGR
jgi:hypothetical protein